MKKILWMLAIGLVGLGGAGAYYVWAQATAIPEWYEEASLDPSMASSPTVVAEVPISSSTPSSSGVAPTPTASAVPRGIAASSPSPSTQLSASPKPTVTALPGVKAVKTQVQQDRLRSGALLDLAAMERLPAGRQSELIQKLLVVMPQLRGRQVYIGVTGKLESQNDHQRLSADSKLAIGKVELPLDDVATQMNLKRADLDQLILRYLQLDQPPLVP
jgi:hypothetical protein